jgi:hypothetical protein
MHLRLVFYTVAQHVQTGRHTTLPASSNRRLSVLLCREKQGNSSATRVLTVWVEPWPFKAWRSHYVPSVLTSKNFTFYPQSAFMCFVFTSEQRATIALQAWISGFFFRNRVFRKFVAFLYLMYQLHMYRGKVNWLHVCVGTWQVSIWLFCSFHFTYFFLTPFQSWWVVWR